MHPYLGCAHLLAVGERIVTPQVILAEVVAFCRLCTLIKL